MKATPPVLHFAILPMVPASLRLVRTRAYSCVLVQLVQLVQLVRTRANSCELVRTRATRAHYIIRHPPGWCTRTFGGSGELGPVALRRGSPHLSNA